MQKKYRQESSKSQTCFILKLKLPRLLLALPILLGSHAALALDIVPANSSYYYAMGGGSDVSLPPVTDQQDISIGGDVNTNLGGTCGFNPSISIANTISNIQDSLQGLQQSVIGSATSAVGSMPMYLLSKSNKDLYNLLQNTMTSASETFHLSMKSCQDAMNQISNGKSPYQDWFSVSDSQGWLNSSKRAEQGQDVDINDTKQQLTKDPEQYGIPWVHADQNSGGTVGDQVPIKVIYDVAVAGYNVTVDPTLPLDSKTTAATPGLGLAQYWPDADAAGQWARLVLGDITISSQPGQDDTARGMGLMTLVQTCPDGATNTLTCAKTIAENLATIISSNTAPTAEQLKSVSSTEMMATVSLINGIRNKNVEERTIAISKWAQDVALQNVVGEALTLRRILIAGSQTKPVHNLAPALTMVTTSINQLDKDIEDILFQFRVRRELMTNTASVILGDQAQAESSAVGNSTETQTPEMANGAVYKSQD